MIKSTSKSENYLTLIQSLDEDLTIYSDMPKDGGGSGEYMRPGQILLSAWASCINITLRMLLDRENLPYDEVNVWVDMDDEDRTLTKMYSKIEIVSPIPEEKKQQLIQRVSRCPISRILSSQKEFYTLE